MPIEDGSPLHREASATLDPGPSPVPAVEAWDSRALLADERAFHAWLTARAPAPVVSGASQQAEAAREVRAALGRTLARLAAHPGEADASLDALLDAGVPGDLGWEDLFVSLRLVEGYEAFKLLALARYRRYLAGEAPAPAAPETGSASPLAVGRLVEELLPGDLVRVPRGVRLSVSSASMTAPFDLWLAGRRCLLDPRPPARLVDSLSVVHAFREGANLVGRALYAEIALAESLADVSRRHLIVDVLDRRIVALTDLSSRGTCVPEGVLDDVIG